MPYTGGATHGLEPNMPSPWPQQALAVGLIGCSVL